MQLAQPELESLEARQTDWIFVRKLLQDIQEDFARKQRFLLRVAGRWLTALELFRFLEEIVFQDGQASETDRVYHKASLRILHSQGELVLHDLKRHEDIPIDQLGISYDDLSALVAELAYDEAMRYGTTTQERLKDLGAELFGDGRTTG
jgi:hypothetical protein